MTNGRKFTGRWEFDKIVGFGSVLHHTKSQSPFMLKSFWVVVAVVVWNFTIIFSLDMHFCVSVFLFVCSLFLFELNNVWEFLNS